MVQVTFGEGPSCRKGGQELGQQWQRRVGRGLDEFLEPGSQGLLMLGLDGLRDLAHGEDGWGGRAASKSVFPRVRDAVSHSLSLAVYVRMGERAGSSSVGV